MNEMDFWNLAGRAGRQGKEFQGNIFCIDVTDQTSWKNPPPEKRKKYVIKSALDEVLGRNSSSVVEYLFKFFNPLGRYGNCVFYYILGYLLSGAIQTHSRKISSCKRRFLVISMFLFVSGILLLMIEHRIEFGTYSYNWKPLSNQYYRLGGILQAIGIFSLFSLIHFQEEKCGIIKAISTHTIDIYYIHPIIVKLMYDHIFKQAYAGVLQNYIRALIALIISFYLGQFIRKIPFLKRIL